MSGNGHIVELINVTHDVTWVSWGVQYFFLIALSYGAFFLTLPAFVFGRKNLEKIGRLALLIAITCGIAAPIALVSDLNQPGRFYNFYLHAHSSSWMSWGSFFLPAYIALLLLYAWLIYRPGLAVQATGRSGPVAAVSRLLACGGREAPGAVRAAGFLTLIAALLVALYTGTEVGLVRARPLWHTPLLPLVYFTTGVSGAAGLSLLLNRAIADGSETAVRQLSRILVAFLGLTLLLTAAWFLTAELGASPSGEALKHLATQYNPALFTLGWLGLCTILPMLLAWLAPRTAWWAVGLLAAAGAWVFRWSIIIDGQRIPKTGAGFYPYQIPLGDEGLLGILGTAALWVLLVLVVITFLPWQGRKEGSTVQPR